MCIRDRAGIACNSWILALLALAGNIVSTLTACLCKYSREDIRNGLYGFNGTLVGIDVYKRQGVDKQTYLKDYLYECSYVNSGYTMTRNYYKFPNEWIIDAVNISNKAQYVWNVVDPSLDMGFTYCGEVASDKNRYNKSVRRKVLSTTPDGRKILKDTNNSTEDFEAKATPSLKQ